jgi:hypothetical protein
MTEALARLEDLRKENTELKERVAWLDAQLQVWDPVYSIRQALPSNEEAASLLKIVCGRYPHLKENSPEQERIDNFLCSLAYIFSLKQTTTPTVAYTGPWWATEGNMWATNARLRGRVRTLIPSIIACGSIPYMLDHGSIYLDPHRARGTAVDRTSWKRVLAGSDLLQAVPVKAVDDRSIGRVKVQAMW